MSKITLTKTLIESARSISGALNREQGELMGATYPFHRGWIEGLVGNQIEEDVWKRIMDIKEARDIRKRNLLKHCLLLSPSKPTTQEKQLAIPTKDPAYSRQSYEELMNSEAWRSLRYVALQIYGNKCCTCGASPRTGAQIHVDHITPCSVDWSRRLDLLNLQVLCKDCNLGKSNLFEDDWRAA